MDKNTITAFVLIGLILIIFQTINRPSQEELEARKLEKQKQEQIAEQSATQSAPVAAQSQVASSEEVMKMFNQQDPNAEGTKTTLESDKFTVVFDSKGGRVDKVSLKEFNTANGEPVVVMDDEEDRFTYQLLLNNQNFSTQDFNFSIQDQTANSVTYRLSAGEGGYIEQKYQLSEEDYSIDYDLNIVGLQNQINSSELNLKWVTNLHQQEEDIENERYRTSIYYQDDDESVDYLAERTDDEDELEKMKLQWLSFKQHFFNNTLIAKNKDILAGKISSKNPKDESDPTLKVLEADLFIPYDRNPSFNMPMQLYLGPNHYNTLKAKGIGLENTVYLGWTIFRWVNVGFIIPMFNFLNKFISSYGIIILILTVLIKTLLFPLTFRSYKSMAKMGALRPELEAIKKKFPDDMQRQQQETMKLYSKTGVNPVGGCLPQMLQMPILIAMFYFFPSSIELRQESFLWAHDLSTYDSILNLPFTIPFYGSHVSLFTLLMAGASLAYTQLNSQMNAAAANPQMKFVQYFMPFFLIFIFNSFSAGLTYYYFLSNVITFAQQWSIKKFFINEDEIRKELHSNKAKPKKQGKFQQRLEQMLKEQQEKAARAQQQAAERKKK